MIAADISLMQIRIVLKSHSLGCVFINSVLRVLRNRFLELLCNGFGSGHLSARKTNRKLAESEIQHRH